MLKKTVQVFFVCPIIGEFPLGGSRCKVFRCHGPNEVQVDFRSMLNRGNSISASMDVSGSNYFWRHRVQVPLEYWSLSFSFPAVEGSAEYIYRDGAAGWKRCPLARSFLFTRDYVLVRIG
jgi:hypothetical protein